jgi:hypothetical protein
MDLATCEIKLGNTIMVGCFPRLPVRFLLQRELKRAMGYTDRDQAEIAQLTEGEPIPDPSEAGDGYAIACVHYAAVGLCWPEPLPIESLRKHRHDVVAYGEAVFEHFVSTERGTAIDLANEGRRLLYEMIRQGAGELTQEVALERDFTGAREPASTGG